MTPAELRSLLARAPTLPLVAAPTPLEEMSRLSAVLGGGPRLLIKRDDSLTFGFGGNKVRKLSFVAGRAQADGADTLITAGAVQSNHARVTASVAARLGMHAILVVNGSRPERPTGNALLDSLLGAEIDYVGAPEDRGPRMQEIAARLRAEGRKPFVIPLGASSALGGLGYVDALLELLDEGAAPDAIVHSSSSGGTQAGLVAAARLLGLPLRVIGISADDSAQGLQGQVRAIVAGIGELLDVKPEAIERGTAIEVDDRFVGSGYGLPTADSREAIDLAARTEAIFLDPTYTGKAMAGLIAYVRQQRFTEGQTVVFWHTGGQVGLFA